MLHAVWSVAVVLYGGGACSIPRRLVPKCPPSKGMARSSPRPSLPALAAIKEAQYGQLIGGASARRQITSQTSQSSLWVAHYTIACAAGLNQPRGCVFQSSLMSFIYWLRTWWPRIVERWPPCKWPEAITITAQIGEQGIHKVVHHGIK